MVRGLLESLKQYRPREGKDPLENFITEAFAWILRENPAFSAFFLKKLDLGIEIESTNCEWITQYNFNGIYPDMVCFSNNNAIVFEHKAWGELHDNQIENYRTYAIRSFEKYKMVLITASKFQHKQSPDLALCWNNVYEYISEWEANNDASFIFKDFRRLLDSEGMGPLEPISSESLRYYYVSSYLKMNISNLIKGNLEEKYRNEWPDLYIEDKKGLYYAEAWGRMGINLFKAWKPGIFVGILLDGADHCTEPIDKFKGPDFSIIISFDRELHDKYQHNKHYKEFVDSISRKVTELDDGWDFYHHIEDKNRRNINKWHPIHIRKPAIQVFAGTQTIEGQVNNFYNEAKIILDMINNEGSFQKLRNVFVCS